MNEHRKHALDRANRELEGTCLAQPDFVKFTRDKTIEAVYCRVCGVPIKSLAEHEDVHAKDRPGRTVYKMLLLVTHNDYTEFTVRFDDGSSHVMNICTSCRRKLDDQVVREMYAADLLMCEKECQLFKIDNFPWQLYAYRMVRSYS